MVKFVSRKSEPGTGGPSSSIGIMRFFDADSKSPKLSPYFVVGAAAVFILIMLILGMMM